MNKKITLLFYLNKSISLVMLMMLNLSFGQVASESSKSAIPINVVNNSNLSVTKNWISTTSKGNNPSVKVQTASGIAEPSIANTSSFIKNIGQYGETMKGYEEMGNIKFGYEGLDMPILFTPKGLIHLHRKYERISHSEEEQLEKQGIPE